MTAYNLGVVFGPTLFRSINPDDTNNLSSASRQNLVATSLIAAADELFPGSIDKVKSDDIAAFIENKIKYNEEQIEKYKKHTKKYKKQITKKDSEISELKNTVDDLNKKLNKVTGELEEQKLLSSRLYKIIAQLQQDS